MLAKQAAESNDGRQAQSIDPSRETSADPWQFERSAYSAMDETWWLCVLI
jgi:hypothetical protein